MQRPSVDQVGAVPFPSLAAMNAEHGRLLKEQIATEDSEVPVDQIVEFIERSKFTGRLLEAERERLTAQTLLDYWATTLYRICRREEEAVLCDFDPHADHRELDDEDYPYRAPSNDNARQGFALETERLLNACLERLDEHRLACIVGASGSGKTAVLRSLTHALEQNALVNSAHWRPFVVQFVEHPLEELISATRPDVAGGSGSIDAEARRWQEDPNRLSARVAEAEAPPALVVIRGFENIFSKCDDGQRKAIVANLIDLIEDPNGVGSVVLVMESDDLWRIEQVPELTKHFRQGMVFVSFNADELRVAIMKPAEAVGLKFDEDLVDALISDVLGDPAALALLQFTLGRLWDLRDGDRITWAAYNQLGGGGRLAVAHTAEDAYQELDDSERAVAEKLCRKLIQPDLEQDLASTGGALVDELVHQDGATKEQVTRVLEVFEKARLVNITPANDAGERRVHIAHAALAPHWPRLVAWIGEQRDAIRRRLRVTDATKNWLDRSRDTNALWRGALLEDAENYTDLTDQEREFVQASRRAVEEAQNAKVRAAEREAETQKKLRRRSQQVLAVTTIGLVAVLCALAALASVNRTLAKARRELEDKNEKLEQAQADLEDKNQRLEDAQDELKDKNKKLAEANADLDRDRVELMLTHSNQRLEAGDVGEALVWSAEASRKNPDAALAGSPLLARLVAGIHQHAHLNQLWQFPATQSGDEKEAGAESPEGHSAHDPRSFVVSKAQYDSTGERLLVTTREKDGTGRLAQILDVRSGNWLEFEPGEEQITQATWSPDDNFVATASESQLQIWDMREFNDLKENTTLTEPTFKISVEEFDGIDHLAISPNGRYLALGATRLESLGEVEKQSEIRIWDVTTTPASDPFADDPIVLPSASSVSVPDSPDADNSNGTLSGLRSLAFSRHPGAGDSGKPQLLAAAFGSTLIVWKLDGQQTSQEHREDTEITINRLAFSEPGDALIAAGGAQRGGMGAVKCWERAAGESTQGWQQTKLLPFPNGVTHAEFSPCGNFVVTASHSGSSELYHRRTWNRLATFRHGSSVFHATFSPDSRYAATASRDAKVKIWEVATGTLAMPPLNHEGTVSSVEFSPDGTRLLSRCRNVVRQWSVGTPNQPRRMLAKLDDLRFAALSSDGEYCGTIHSSDGLCTVWSGLSGQPTHTSLAGESVDSACLFRDADGPGIITVSREETGEEQTVFVIKRRLIGDNGRTKPPKVVASTDNPVKHVAANKDGSALALVIGNPNSREGVVKVVTDASTGQAAIHPVGTHEDGAVLWVAFHPSKNLLVTASSDDTARLWNWPQSGEDESEVREPLRHSADVVFAEFSPDGKYVVTASMDRRAGLWCAETGVELAMIRHSGYVTNAVFDRTSNYLATTSHDGFVRIWRIQPDESSKRAQTTLVSSAKITARPLRVAFAGNESDRLISLGAYSPRLIEELYDGDPMAPARLTVRSFTLAETGVNDVGSASRADDLEAMQEMSDLLGVRTFDTDRQDTTLLESSELSKLWQAISKADLPLPTQSAAAKAEEAKLTGEWFAEAWYLKKLINAGNGNAERKDELDRALKRHAAQLAGKRVELPADTGPVEENADAGSTDSETATTPVSDVN